MALHTYSKEIPPKALRAVMPLKFQTQPAINTRLQISNQSQLYHIPHTTEIKVKHITLFYTENQGKKVVLILFGQLLGLEQYPSPQPYFSQTVFSKSFQNRKEKCLGQSLHFPLKNNMRTKTTMIFPYCHHSREVIFSTTDTELNVGTLTSLSNRFPSFY